MTHKCWDYVRRLFDVICEVIRLIRGLSAFSGELDSFLRCVLVVWERPEPLMLINDLTVELYRGVVPSIPSPDIRYTYKPNMTHFDINHNTYK